MSRVWFTALLALCACLSSMVRAPRSIPADGVVECTETMEVPLRYAVAAAVSGGAFAIALSHPGSTISDDRLILPLLLGAATYTMVLGAFTGFEYVSECKDAKRRGAEIAWRAQGKARARAEAGKLWKRAYAAARADDCATVRELGLQVRDLDVEFHAVVFARDVAIMRCLATRE